jgi:hypothetical protein
MLAIDDFEAFGDVCFWGKTDSDEFRAMSVYDPDRTSAGVDTCPLLRDIGSLYSLTNTPSRWAIGAFQMTGQQEDWSCW